MKFRNRILRVGLSLTLAALPISLVHADPVPALFLREVKITGDEFVVLQASQTVDLGDFWLGYSSSDTPANIVPSEQLPAQTLQAGQAILLTSDGSSTCDAVLIAKLSFSLSDTKGTLALRQLSSSGDTSTFTTIDSANWSKPAASASTADDIDLRKETSAISSAVWHHTPAQTSWQVGDFMDCTLTLSDGTASGVTSVTWPQSDIDPPAVIESLADDRTTAGPYLPAVDVGLLPPQITELLPNPSGTGTDGTDEFIELYNPNSLAFDLSGFVLQSGLTTKHSFTFPAGTSLPPKNFVAFYSAQTGLTLSNTSGQADLQDPFGTVMAQSNTYGTAKDGTAWALAKGSWYWTVQPTPDAANVINQTSASIRTTSAKKVVAAVKGASTTKSPLQSTATNTAASADTTAPAPVHPLILVVVAVLAVGYGVYEYRHDLANKLHQFRANRKAR